MTQDEAIAKARTIATEEGWTWREPVHAALENVGDSGTIFSDVIGRLSRSPGGSSAAAGGREAWQVFSNAGSRGVNVVVTLDAESGEVLKKSFRPR